MSNLESQLKGMGLIEKMPQILEEVYQVRADMGYPPLATPFAQMVGSQAAFNVMLGERYKMMPKEVKEYVKGRYGKAPGPLSQELVEKSGEIVNAVTCRPGDLLEPAWEKGKAEAYEKGFAACQEDALIYIMFPAVGEAFLKKKYGKG